MFQHKFVCDACEAVWLSAPLNHSASDQVPGGWLIVRFSVDGDKDPEIHNRPAPRTFQDACSRECAARLAEAFAEKLRTG